MGSLIGPLQAVTPSIMHPWNVFIFVSLLVMVISFYEVSGQQDCEGNWVNGKCIDHSSRKRRSCEVLENGVCKEDDRKRRSTCEDGVLVNGKCETTERKRRSNDCKEWVNGVCKDNERKRRSTCENGVLINGVCKTADRKRRSNDDELFVIDEDDGDSDDKC